MAIVRPFKAIRPTRDKANLVASRSYLSYSDETLKEKLEHNPYTFLHIINPDYKSKTKLSGIEKYKVVKEKFQEFINEGILNKENKEAFYIYQQSNSSHTFTGIIGATAVEDYLNNKVKKHEQTLTARENMFKNYLETTGFNAEPVLLSHEPNNKIKEVIDKYKQTRSEYEFATTNKSVHKLWIVNDSNDINTIKQAFNSIENLYIADGHHRCASSSLLSKDSNSELSNYFMSYLIDEEQLNIINFNRLIKTLNGLSAKEFLKQVEESYSVSLKENTPYSPTLKDEISIYLDGKWYSAIAKNTNYNTTTDSLDPSILSEKILKPLLNIVDEKTDQNISFLDGTHPLSEIKNKVDSGEFAVAFILKPIPISSIKKVADNNEIMPPKSTYVEPKLRSGLTIYPL